MGADTVPAPIPKPTETVVAVKVTELLFNRTHR